jgi:hypothetical protein
MGSSFFVSTEVPVEGIDLTIDGKALALNENALSSFCEGVGVTPLLTFLSPSVDQQRAVLESSGIFDVPYLVENWFTAEDGLVTVAKLLEIVPQQSQWLNRVDELLRDLQRLQEILHQLEAAGVRWHLDIDL